MTASECTHISRRLGGHQALIDVSFAIASGEVLGIVGPNGAGKTTLLRVASGLLRPTQGQILIDGVDVTGEPPFQLVHRGVCHVPEGRGVFTALTVGDNVRLALLSESGLYGNLWREHEFAMRRPGLLLPGIRGSLEG